MTRSVSRQARSAAERRGRRAEWAAIAYLLVKGYRPLARRVRTPLGEIDLVMRRGRVTVMVEVKARRDLDTGLDALGLRQRQRLVRAARWWLAKHPAFAQDDVRFDLVLVSPGRWPAHIPDAFS